MTALFVLTAAALSADPGLAWKQTDHSLALARGGEVLWQFNYAKAEGKPYFHPVRVAGETVTDLRPADHPWHRGIWFSWKLINGVLYWEEDPKTGTAPGETELGEVKVTPGVDHSARFALKLAYHPPGQPPVLTEERTVEVSPPARDGSYRIDWRSVFTAGRADVKLDRTPVPGEKGGVDWGGYAGLSLRLAPALKAWRFADADGPVTGRAKDARWMAFAGPTWRGSAVLAVLDHPGSFRHPTPWYLINDMPYFSPAVLYRAPYTLPAGQMLTLRYRILLIPGKLDSAALEKEWRRYADER